MFKRIFWFVASTLLFMGALSAQQVPLKAWNVGGDLEDYPATFSVVAQRGRFPGKMVLVDDSGNTLPTQCNIISRHPDGSVQHALLSTLLDISAGEVLDLKAKKGSTPLLMSFKKEGKPVGAFVRVSQGANKWTRAVYFDTSNLGRVILPFPGARPGHLIGKFVTEFESPPLELFQGSQTHSHLKVIFRFRYFLGHGWRTETVFENVGAPSEIGDPHWGDWIDFTPADVPYDSIEVYTSETKSWHVVSEADVLYDGTRMVWRDKPQQVFGITDPAYLRRATGPRDLTQSLGMPNSHGPINSNMPGVGDRPDIGVVPKWHHTALRTFGRSVDAWHWFLAGEYNGVGTCNWHVRDSEDGILGVTSERAKYGVRDRYKKGDRGRPKVQVDTAHLPNLTYAGWMFTGDRYLESAMSAIASHVLVRYPWQEPIPRYYGIWGRRHAWEQRTVMLVAKLLPDRHPRKQWLLNTVQYNLEQDIQATPRLMGNYDTGQYKGSAHATWVCGTRTAIWNWNWVVASWGWLFQLYGDTKAKQAFDNGMRIYVDAWAKDGQSYQGSVGPPLVWNRLRVFEYSMPVQTYTPRIHDRWGWHHVDGSFKDVPDLLETAWWKWVNESNDIDYDDWINKRWPPFPDAGPEAENWLPNLNEIPISVIGTGQGRDPTRIPADYWLYYAARWLWPMAADLGYPFMWEDPEIQRIIGENELEYVRLR
jgi:hypothetical protein